MKWVLSDGLRDYDFLTNGDIYVAAEGLTLPIPGLEGTFLESQEMDGRRRTGSHPKNGEGSFRVHFRGGDNTEFWAAVDNLQELVASAHRRKGTLTYEPGDKAATVTWDLESIRVTGLPEKTVHTRQRHGDAEVTFETRPYARRKERDLGSPVTLPGPVAGFTVEKVGGQVDAFGRLRLTDLDSQSRQLVEIGVQNSFDQDTPEPLLNEAIVNLVSLAGVPATRAGSYSTQVIRGGVHSLGPTPLCGTPPLPHHGLWKVRARVYTSGPAVRVRLVWQVGGGSWSKERWVTIPAENGWYDLDVGTIDIRELAASHSWSGRIEAQCLSGLPTIDVDLMMFIPADRYFIGRGATIVEEPSSPLIAVDDFLEGSGNLTGKVPQLAPSGNWSGAADMTFSRGVVTSEDTTDVDWGGNYVRCGTGTLAAARVSVDYKNEVASLGTQLCGVFARYNNADHWLMATAERNLGGVGRVQLVKRSFGVTTILETAFGSQGSSWHKIILDIGVDGVARVYQGSGGSVGLKITHDCGADFRAGGVHASDGYGFYEQSSDTAAGHGFRRHFTRFSVFSPAAGSSREQPVIHSGDTFELTHEDALTEDDTTISRSPVREGQYLTLPPATRAKQKSRVVVRARRSHITDDGLTDDLQATLAVTERVTLGRA